MSRLVDIILSLLFIVILFPIIIIIAIWIKLDSSGTILYRQARVGRFGKEFMLYKFRSMAVGSDKESLLTYGKNSNRITSSGKFLRKFKLDELPQLVNVIAGDMSIVGPRPEVRKYVDLYTDEQKSVLNVRPGITDYASIKYYNEAQILDQQSNPEEYYINTIMPEKIRLNQKYLQNPSLTNYFSIIVNTIKAILK